MVAAQCFLQRCAAACAHRPDVALAIAICAAGQTTNAWPVCAVGSISPQLDSSKHLVSPQTPSDTRCRILLLAGCRREPTPERVLSPFAASDLPRGQGKSAA